MESKAFYRPLPPLAAMILVVAAVVLLIGHASKPPESSNMADWSTHELTRFGPAVRKILTDARTQAGANSPVSTGDILIGIMRNCGSFDQLLRSRNIDPRKIYVDVRNVSTKESVREGREQVTHAAHQTIENALLDADARGLPMVTPKQLVEALLNCDGVARDVLLSHGITLAALSEMK